MKSSLTGRGVALLVIACCLIAMGKVLGIPECTAMGIASLLLILGCVVVVAWARRSVRGQRLAPIRVDFDSSAPAQCESTPLRFLEVTVTESLALPGESDLASARARGSIVAYRIPSRRRGVVQLGPLHARIDDPFGIAFAERSIAAISDCVVHPKRVELGRVTAAHLWRRGLRQRGEGDPSTIREFQPGDELRTIHWRASARQDTLMVRDDRHNNNQLLTLTVDLRPTERLEDVISAAYSIAWSWLENGAVRCLDQSGQVFLECPRAGLVLLGDAFGRISPNNTPATSSKSDLTITAVPRWSPKDRTILFADPTQRSHAWILVTDDFAEAWNSVAPVRTPR